MSACAYDYYKKQLAVSNIVYHGMGFVQKLFTVTRHMVLYIQNTIGKPGENVTLNLFHVSPLTSSMLRSIFTIHYYNSKFIQAYSTVQENTRHHLEYFMRVTYHFEV